MQSCGVRLQRLCTERFAHGGVRLERIKVKLEYVLLLHGPQDGVVLSFGKKHPIPSREDAGIVDGLF